MKQPIYCPNHPRAVTNLRCGRCEKLVCPECMVHTPVGVRCMKCGKGAPPPTYQVSASYLTRAVAISAATGVFGGLLLPALPVSGFLYLIAMGGFGYLIAEAISWVANRKRGRALQIVAGAGVVLSAGITAIISATTHGYIDLFALLGMGLGVYVAYIRLR